MVAASLCKVSEDSLKVTQNLLSGPHGCMEFIIYFSGSELLLLRLPRSVSETLSFRLDPCLPGPGGKIPPLRLSTRQQYTLIFGYQLHFGCHTSVPSALLQGIPRGTYFTICSKQLVVWGGRM